MYPDDIVIPQDLRPRDGRFGSGPSKVPPEALASLASDGASLMGTSHRQPPVRALVRRVREGLRTLFSLPDDHEVVLGVGGATAFWDAAAFCLIERRSQHLVFGEFSSKFAVAVAAAEHLSDPDVIESEPGTHPLPVVAEVDAYALTHNETSTGVAMPLERVAPGAFTLVDGTSAAGGMRVDPGACDAYYFSPQKGFAADGGLWIALCSPAAVERIEKIAATGRYVPPSLDLPTALENSRKDQTYNTPSIATLFLIAHQIDWLLSIGGLERAAARCERSAATLYGWADASPVAQPFVSDPAQRSPVVATIDFASSVDAPRIAATLRANGIVDTEPYRKLGRNQLRIALYPAIDPEDVERLTRAIDFVIGNL